MNLNQSTIPAFIVQDPRTGRSFDLKPVLDAFEMHLFGSPEHAQSELTEAFEFIAMNARIEEEYQQRELQSILFTIKKVKDMFAGITELSPKNKK